MKSIVIATGNPGKLREIKEVLADLPVEIIGLENFPGIPEAVEDGRTFGQNACKKAIHYSKATGLPCLADDSGLVVDALGGEPGVHSARYAADRCEEGADRHTVDAANNIKLLEELQAVPDEKRTARFVCHIALADGDNILIETEDSVEGRIIHEARGRNGFGYDPLFFVSEKCCTTAELPQDQKNQISHRGKALRHFAKQLQEMLK